MHVAEGFLSSTPTGQCMLLGGAVIAAAGTAVGLVKLDDERIPQAGVLSAAFFVASAIQVPLGPASVHLLLGGLMGIVLGWLAFPAVLVALLLQAVFLSLGGISTLGLNTVTMALPAVVCSYLFHAAVRSPRQQVVFCAGFAAGMLAVVLGLLLLGGAMILAGKSFEFLGKAFVETHLPVAIVEGFVTGSVVVLLRKVRPEVLAAAPLDDEIAEVQEATNG